LARRGGAPSGAAGGIARYVSGIQIYHNYVRPHEALDGKTPAEACGIVVECETKWITLIQNASQKAKAK